MSFLSKARLLSRKVIPRKPAAQSFKVLPTTGRAPPAPSVPQPSAPSIPRGSRNRFNTKLDSNRRTLPKDLEAAPNPPIKSRGSSATQHISNGASGGQHDAHKAVHGVLRERLPKLQAGLQGLRTGGTVAHT